MDREQMGNLILAARITNHRVYRTYEAQIRDIARIANQITEICREAES